MAGPTRPDRWRTRPAAPARIPLPFPAAPSMPSAGAERARLSRTSSGQPNFGSVNSQSSRRAAPMRTAYRSSSNWRTSSSSCATGKMLRDRQGRAARGRQLRSQRSSCQRTSEEMSVRTSTRSNSSARHLLQLGPADQLLHPRAGFLPQVETVAVQLAGPAGHLAAGPLAFRRRPARPQGSRPRPIAKTRNRRQVECTATFAGKWEEIANPTGP